MTCHSTENQSSNITKNPTEIVILSPDNLFALNIYHWMRIEKFDRQIRRSAGLIKAITFNYTNEVNPFETA